MHVYVCAVCECVCDMCVCMDGDKGAKGCVAVCIVQGLKSDSKMVSALCKYQKYIAEPRFDRGTFGL